jgi:hypothetical protein
VEHSFKPYCRLEIDIAPNCLPGLCAGEICARYRDTSDHSPNEIRLKSCRVELGINDRCATTIRFSKVRPVTIASHHDRADQLDPLEIRLLKMAIDQLRPSQIRPGKVRSIEVDHRQAAVRQIRSRQIHTREVRSLAMEVLAELFQLAIPFQDDPDMFSVGHGRRTAYSVSSFSSHSVVGTRSFNYVVALAVLPWECAVNRSDRYVSTCRFEFREC